MLRKQLTARLTGHGALALDGVATDLTRGAWLLLGFVLLRERCSASYEEIAEAFGFTLRHEAGGD